MKILGHTLLFIKKQTNKQKQKKCFVEAYIHIHKKPVASFFFSLFFFLLLGVFLSTMTASINTKKNTFIFLALCINIPLTLKKKKKKLFCI